MLKGERSPSSSEIWDWGRLSGGAWSLKLLKSELESQQELTFPDFDTGRSFFFMTHRKGNIYLQGCL